MTSALPVIPPSYDPHTIISQLHEFYTFLPHVPSSSVKTPPPGGWPSITHENLAKHDIHKTPEVIALLKQLPYLSGPHPWIAVLALACDYRLVGEELTIRTKPGWLYDVACPQWPPWTIQLTAGTDREGHNYILDITDSTVSRYCVMAPCGSPKFDEIDPRSWRDRYCEPEVWTLQDLLEDWKGSYKSMKLLGVPQPEEYPLVESPDIYSWQDEIKMLREIYREHGWPDNYQKDTCIQALHAWWLDSNNR